jgi:hypothetical protein
MMKNLLPLVAFLETATGLALIIAPSIVVQLLLGDVLAPSAVSIARVAGIALVGLAIACSSLPPLAGMLFYSAAVTILLGYLGITGEATGILLWPAVIAHAILTGLLAWHQRSP